MNLQTMYEGKAFSPVTTLVNNIGASDTVIQVSDISVFPPAPNLATIGIDENAETIRYTAIAGNALSGCQRGIEGTARSWNMDSMIARNFTAYDYQQLVANIIASVQKNDPGNAAEILFLDGDSFQDKLDAGDLNGADGATGHDGQRTHPATNIRHLKLKTSRRCGEINTLADNFNA